MGKSSISIDLKVQSSQVQQWAEGHGVTVSAVFEGLWAILLNYHSGSESASFRVSQETSSGASVEDCHVEVDQDLSFTDFIRSLQKTVVTEQRSQSRRPSLTALQETQIWSCSGPADLTRIDQAEALVTIVLEQQSSRLSANLRYTPTALSRDEAQRLVDSLAKGVTQILENPSILIDDIDFLSQDQYNLLMKQNSPYPESHGRSAHELISIRAASQPSAEAICSTEVSLTYRRLEELSNGFARVLAEAGVGPEVVVPMCSPKSPWAVLALLAIIKAGGAYAIIPPDTPPARVEHILEVLDAKIVLATPETVDKFTSVQTFVFSADFFNSLPKAPLFAKFGRVKPHNAFCVIFTSGSTGLPKAITVEHRNHVTSSRATAKYFGWTPKTRIFQYSAYNWDVSVRDIFGGLMTGCCVCVPTDQERLDSLSATITRFKADFLSTTPTVLKLLSPKDVPTFKTISAIGEKLTDDLTKTWSGHVRFINDYGPAEITVSSSMRDVNGSPHPSANIGTRLSSCLHWVTNPRNPNTLVPIGAVGELVVQGPTVTRGYRKDPKKTAAAYAENLVWQRKLGYPEDKQRIYRTGDVVRLMADGTFEYIGRRDTQIKINGQRTEISEIESQLVAAAPSPVQIYVSMISSSDRPEKKVLAAFIESSQGPQAKAGSGILPPSTEVAATASTIKATVVERLPSFMIPSHYFPIASAPRSASGKLDRSLLQKWACQLLWKDLSAYAGASSEKVQTSTSAEKNLRELWAAVLNVDVDSIGANDHFIQLGGDSIAAIRLSRAAREKGMTLSSKSILEQPVLSKMAALIVSGNLLGLTAQEAPEPFSLVDASFVASENLKRIAEDIEVPVDAIEDAYPCTSLQGDLMASTMLDSEAYISQQVFKLPENVDIDTFQAAWDHIHALTPILRTRIQSVMIAGRPRLVQLVIDETISWGFGSDLQDYLSQDKKIGMALGQQLCRFALLSTSESQYFVWTAHHAIYDGWSLELLLDDVSALYQGTLPELRPSVNTFVRHLESQDPKLCQKFWESYLNGYKTSEFLQLPSDKASALATKTISHTVTAPLANSAQVTTSAMMRVAWAMVLAQHSGSSDVVFGCTQSGRTIDGVDADMLVAPMFATVPVRVKCDKAQPAKAVLTQAQSAANEMLQYEHVGLQTLRQYNEACRQASEFQTILIVQAPTVEKPFPFDGQQHLEGDELLTYALGIECLPQGDQLRIDAHFDPEIINEDIVERMLVQFESFLAQFSGGSDAPVKAVDTLSAKERNEQERFNDNGAQCIDACVHNVIRQRTFLSPHALALKDDSTELTYQQLDNVSQRLASHLAAHGVGPEVIVPLCFEKSVWAAVSMLAVLRAGGACVALDVALPDARMAEIIKKTAARQILVSPAQQHRFKSTNLNKIVIDQRNIEKLPKKNAPPRVTVRPDNAAFVVFTSGSTGTPKGIMLEHRNVCSTAQTMHNVQFLNSSSRVLQWSSWTFDPYIEEIFITLMFGGSVFIPSEDDRRNDVAGFINRMQVNWMDVTPTLMGMMHPEEVPSLKTLVCGGEPLSQEIVDRWAEKVNVVYTYGPAECSIICTSLRTPMKRDADSSNVGHPMGGSIWMVNPDDHNRLVSVGSVGEILVEGPIVARKYLNDPQATSKSFIVDPAWAIQESGSRRFYKTGDLARYNKDGSICIVGRKDSQIKINGQRVELGDIEHAIAQLIPHTSRVIVEAISESAGSSQKQLVAFITYPEEEVDQLQRSICLDLTEDLRLSLTEVQEKLRSMLPQHMVPQLFVPVASHPETNSGKTDRKALRQIGQGFSKEEKLLYSLVSTGSKRQPTTQQEKTLRTLWSSVLNMDEKSIGAEDKFFQLGGNSIAAMHLATAARAMGLLIIVRDVFEHPKLCDLAKRMTSTKKPTESPLVSSSVLSITPFSELSVTPASDFSMISPSELSATSPSVYSVKLSYEAPVAIPSLKEIEKQERVIEDVANQLGCDDALIEDVYLCTPLQQNLMASTVRDNSSYVLREIFQLPNNVDLRRFKGAWNKVCSRFAILRTRIMPVETSEDTVETYQVVVNESAEWTEATNLNQFLEQDQARGMDYGKQLCRFTIINGRGSKYFVFTVHHAAYDGWSLPLIYKAVSDSYNGLEIAPSIPFKKFVRHVQNIDQEQSAAFWEEQMAQSVPTLFPSTSNQEREIHATETVASQFEHQYNPKRNSDVTLSIVVQAAWGVLLSKYADSQDVVFGSINAGRNTPLTGIETMVGPTIATVPLRIQINKNETVRRFLRRLQTQSLDIAEHQHFGLDRIARVSADARKATQFQNLLVIQPGEDDDADDSALLQLPKIEQELKDFMSFPLSVQCTLGAKSITTTANFDPSFITATDIERILEQLAHVTRQLLKASGSTKVAEIDLLSQGDLSQLSAWNKYEPYTVERSIPDIISDFVHSQPDAEAVCGWDGSLTYAELDDLSTRLARFLRRTFHAQANDRIPFCTQKSVWTVVAMLAILKVGGSTIALDPSFPVERISAILGASEARFIITQSKFERKFDLMQRNVVVIDEAMIKSLPAVGTLDLPKISPKSPACILFSSGTTGTPKGIILEHQAIASAGREHGRFSGVKPGTRVLQFAAYTFDVSIQDIFMTLTNGGCICVPSDSQRLDDIASAINTMNVNWTFLTPTVAKLLDPATMPRLKTLVLGGEAMPAESVATWTRAVTLFNGYGPAEAGTVVAIRKMNESHSYEPSNVGRSIKSVRSWVTDAEDPEQLLPIGSIGELLVEGPSLAISYLNNLEKTAASFIQAPKWAKTGKVVSTHKWRFYRTGDLVRQRPDGSFDFLGRKDMQVKLHGQRLELDDIETQIKAAFDCECQIAVDVVQPAHRAGADLLTAFVCLKENESSNPKGPLIASISQEYTEKVKEVKVLLTTRLPVYSIPALWIPVTCMPTSLSQKLDRKVLRSAASSLSAEELASCSFLSSKKRAPVSDVEMSLASLWASLLKLSVNFIGLDDSFFEIGGDSITAMKLVTLARKNKMTLSMETIFRHPKLVEMAAVAGPAKSSTQVVQKRQLPALSPFALMAMNQQDLSSYLSSLESEHDLVRSEIVDAYPCTPMQEGLFALTMSDSSLYMAQFAFEMAPDTDVELFVNAWNDVVRSLPVLRTVIVPAPTQLYGRCNSVQVVLDKPASWQRYRGNEVEKFLAAEMPKNVGHGTNMVKFAIIEGQKRYFSFTVHHAFYDGWSLPMIFSLLEQSYFGSPKGKIIPYSRFVQNLSGVAQTELTEFWTEYLIGYTATGFPKLPNPKYVPSIDAQIEKKVALKAAKVSGVMPATLIQTAWAMVLGAHSQSDDVVFLSTQIGRSSDLEDIEEIIGCTVTTIPVRFTLNGTEQLGNYLRQSQDRSNNLMKYEHYGMRNIQRLGPEQKTACQAGCLMVIQPQPENSDSKLGLKALADNDTQMLSYPLVIEANLGAGFVNMRFGFDTNLLSKETMGRIADEFASILESLYSKSETTKMSEIDVLSPAELAVLKEWNTSPPKYENETVQEQFRRGVKRWPHRVAIDAWDAHMSYADLDRLSDNLAQHLLSFGLKRQQVIPLIFEKSAWTVVAMMAVAKAACTFVLFEPTTPMDRCLGICQEVDCRMVLASREQTANWKQHYVVFTVDEASLNALSTVDADLNVSCDATDLLYLIFTSGSTGKPKGCMTEHGSFLSVLQGQRDASDFGISDRMLQNASYSFDISLLEIFSSLMLGARLCIPTQHQCSTNVAEVLRSYKITWGYITPSLARAIDPSSVPHLRALALVGEQVMPVDVAKWADKLSLINGYGPSESVAASSYIGVKSDGEPSNIGLPMGCVCWIVDPDDHDKLVPLGTVGELVIDGPIVSPGYFKNPEKTAECFINNTKWLTSITGRKHARLYKTGDLAKQNIDRTITFVGRKDTQVKVRGQRMELGEPEHHISEDALVHSAVVLKGQKGSLVDGQLVAIMQLLEKTTSRQRKGAIQYLNASAKLAGHVTHLTTVLEKKMPLYMIPTTWLFLEAMPLLPAGKIDRKRLQGWISQIDDDTLQQCVGASERSEDDANMSSELAHLRDAVSKALSMPADKVKLNRSFAAQGGDSISAMQVHSQLRKLRLKIEFKDIIVATSLIELAKTLKQIDRPEESAIAVADEQSLEPFALAPMQAWYAKYALREDPLSRSTNINFNFTFNFNFKTNVSLNAVRNALEAMVQRHSMLRTRFYEDGSGKWKQVLTNDVQGSYRLEYFETTSCTERDMVLEASRTSLDIKNGPLLRGDVIVSSDGQRSLHVVLHHLVTDRVSWSILLADLERHINNGSLPEEPPFSFQVWSEMQAKDAAENWPPHKALPYGVPDANLDFWGMADKQNTVQQSMTHGISLPVDLLDRVRTHTGIADLEVSDILSTALSISFKHIFPERDTPTIFNQGHGRDAYHSDIDLSQTVGWFTTYWPIHVMPRPEEDSTGTLQRTINLRQSLPHNGRAYMASRYHHADGIKAFAGHDNMEVYLNYLGDLRKHTDDNTILEMIGNVDSGLHGEADVKRLALFDVNALVEEDGFRVAFAYNQNSKHRARIEKWVRAFEIHLLELAGLDSEHVGEIPSMPFRADMFVIQESTPTPIFASPLVGLREKLFAVIKYKSSPILRSVKSSAMMRTMKFGRREFAG